MGPDTGPQRITWLRRRKLGLRDFIFAKKHPGKNLAIHRFHRFYEGLRGFTRVCEVLRGFASFFSMARNAFLDSIVLAVPTCVHGVDGQMVIRMALWGWA